MDAYDSDGFRFWNCFPAGYGSRSMYSLSNRLMLFAFLNQTMSNTNPLDRPLSLACPRPSGRHSRRRPGILPRPRAQRPPIRQEPPRLIRQLADAHAGRASRSGRLSEVAP
jgi:hypothetical protein